MKKFTNRFENSEVLIEGDLKSYSEAGPLLVKRIIEEDLPESPYFQKGADPYKWLGALFGKTERGIRAWTYDWSGQSGSRPNVEDFFYLVSIAGSNRAVAFLNSIGSGITPKEQVKHYGNLIKTIADHIQELVDDLNGLAEKYEDGYYKNNDTL